MKRATLLAALVAGMLVLPAPSAPAHEGEEEIPARTLVKQAIALLRGQPEQTDAIMDKILDALGAGEVEGVDLELVERAEAAFEAGDLHEAQDLLERSIGATPHEVVVSPNLGPGLPAPDEPAPEPAPVLHEQALEPGDQSTAGAPLLIGLAIALAAGGALVVRRIR